MGISVKVDGLDETRSFLQGLPDKIQTAIDNALSDLEDNIINTTTSLVPVKTGFLQSSISVEKTMDGLTAKAGADYASYVDLGTSRMAAQPFFTDVVTNMMENFDQTLQAKLDDAGIFD